MLGPILRGNRVSLEPAETDDLPVFRRWLADPEITRYLLVRFVPSQGQEEEWYDRVSKDDSTVHWKVVVDGQAIGSTGIHNIDWMNRRGITGLFLGERSQWGKGYASEVVRLRTTFAFRELGLERLESESFESNVAMHRALEKSGYRRFGQRRHYVYRGGRWHDAILFEVLGDEWEAAEAGGS